MKSSIVQRVVKLELARRKPDSFVLWTDPDDPDAEPERIELCGLSHEECLAQLEEEERLQ
jgi:hypothetical protein